MNKTVKGDILKFSESGCLIDDLGTLQYLVIFPNEKRHKFHYTGEAASIIPPIDERVADYIRRQIREGCKTPKDIQCRVAYFVKENKFGGLRVKEAQRNKFIPSRKKIRNLILPVRNETRYSKIDQGNIQHMKEQWMKNGDVFFEPYIKHNFEEEQMDLMKGIFHIFHIFYVFILVHAVSKVIQK